MTSFNITITELLTDLLRINNDRVKGYEKAIEKTDDYHLRNIFKSMIEESRSHARKLAEEIIWYGGIPDNDQTTLAGHLYLLWMDFRSLVFGREFKAILNSCEYGEEAAQQAYREALAHQFLSPSLRGELERQQAVLREALDFIRKIRDQKSMLQQIN